MSQKTKGGISHSLCIAYYLHMGYTVSLPLFDDAPYDLVVDNNDKLLKIQCKTATGSARYASGKNKYPRVDFRQGGYHYPFFISTFDFLWVMTRQFCYLIPSSDLPHLESNQLTSLSLSPKYSTFIVEMPFLNSLDPERKQIQKPLTDAERRRIETLVASGESYGSVAMILGVREQQVALHIAKNGTHQHHVITDDLEKQIIEMRKNKISTVDIAKELGFSKSSVANVLTRSGISKRIPVIKEEWKTDIIAMRRAGYSASDIAIKYKINRPNTIATFLNHQKWLLVQEAPTSGI